MKLDEWAERYLASRGPGQIGNATRTELLDHIICEVATIAGGMHRAGMCHQDLYLCHFLCASERRSIPLTLIDLQRVRRFPGKLPLGRQIKDLGQLLFSAQRFIGPREIRRFWQLYREANPKNSIPGPLMLPMVRIKAARIRHHTRRHGL
jgi:heptose I phosphotransferase